MAELLTEQFVQSRIVDYLADNGWSTSLAAKNLKEHGVDIKVRNDGYARYWLIECKGDASPMAKNPRSAREVNFNLALGQILTRMHSNGKAGYKYRYKYGVGYPVSFRDRVVRRLPHDVCHKLNLYVFLVNPDGGVEVIDWRQLKSMQKGKKAKRKTLTQNLLTFLS